MAFHLNLRCCATFLVAWLSGSYSPIQNHFNLISMKNQFLLFGAFFLLLLSSCQKDDVLTADSSDTVNTPLEVVNAVKKEYPLATKIQFSAISTNEIWESQFNVSADKLSVVLDKKGTILEANTATNEVKLPIEVTTYLTNNFKDFKIITASETFKNKVLVGYKVYLKSTTQEATVIFDAKGAFVMEYKSNLAANNKPVTKNYPIDPKALPDVVAKILAGREFLRGTVVVDKDNKKTYVISLKQGNTYWDIVLDETGKVIKESKIVIEPKKYSAKEVKKADLTKTITDYLDKNHKGWVLDKGVANLINNVVDTYVLTIKIDATKEVWYLVFDKESKMLKSSKISFTIPKIEEKAIALAELPKVVKDYIDGHFKIWTLEKGVVILIDTKVSSYTLLVVEGKDKYLLYFDANGKFIGSKKA